MKRFASRVALVVLLAVGSTGMLGCAKNSVMSGTTALSGLYSSLGGATGVQSLANAFGAKIALNPNVTKFLDAAAIDVVKGGLVNTIAAASGVAIPSGQTDLLGALSGKGLDKLAVDGIGDGLKDAAKETGLQAEQQAAIGALWDPVSKALLK